MRGSIIGTVLRFCGAIVIPATILAACSDSSTTSDANAPLPGVVAQVVTDEDVSDQTDYVGQTRASQRVDIRARVNGTLLKRPFEEGQEVSDDTVLYEIDPAEFEANLLSANAQLAKAEASFAENKRNLERYTTLVEKDSPAVSESQFDIAKSKADQSAAEVSAGKAEVARAKLDLGYATISSPISGRAGISTVDVGNLVGPDSGILVTVLALDPIDVDFAVGEREYLNYREAVAAGKAEDFTPQILLANGRLYPHKGTIDVVNNEVDPATGTISIRIKFPNPERLLLPGQYVNVLLIQVQPKRRVVIPQSAVQENQAGPFVLIVDGESKIESRPIKTGARVGTGVVVEEGLVPGETLVVEGIQKVRPGAKVDVTFQKPSETPGAKAQPAVPDDPDGGTEGAPANGDDDKSAAAPEEDKPDKKMDAEPSAAPAAGDDTDAAAKAE